jgi:hypothetical protein
LNRVLLSIVFVLSCGQLLLAQDTFHIFPEVADGVFSDGTSYRSTLMILPRLDSDAPNCTLVLNGLSATFEGGSRNSTHTFSIPAGGYVAARTTAGQTLATGFATLTCTESVFANMLYSFYAPTGAKISEATVFSNTFEWFQSKLVLDQRNGSQLGIAVANNTDNSHTYDVKLVTSTATLTGSIVVPAHRSLARFVNEILTVPANSVGILTVSSHDFSDFTMIGLRYTGGAFTTIPAN